MTGEEKRKIVWLDTETTSDLPGPAGRICQLAYLVEEKEQRFKNFYFCAGPLSDPAAKVVGLTDEEIRIRAAGRTFGDAAEESAEDFAGALLVAHNFRFDYCFLQYEFSACGVPFRYREELCTAKTFRKALRLPRERGGYRRPKLCEICVFLGICEEEIRAVAQRFGGPPVGGWHDARFDAAAAYLVTRRGKEMGILPGRLS